MQSTVSAHATAVRAPPFPRTRSRVSFVWRSVQTASNLAADWSAFLNNPHLSDIAIEVGGQTVHAHRVVLAARCSYFRAMFKSGMRESTSGTIALDDIDCRMARSLLAAPTRDCPRDHRAEARIRALIITGAQLARMLDQAVPKPSRTGWADTVFLALLEHLGAHGQVVE